MAQPTRFLSPNSMSAAKQRQLAQQFGNNANNNANDGNFTSGADVQHKAAQYDPRQSGAYEPQGNYNATTVVNPRTGYGRSQVGQDLSAAVHGNNNNNDSNNNG